MIPERELIKFIQESDAIEGIRDDHHADTIQKLRVYQAFLELDIVTVKDLEKFVNAMQPGAKLRTRMGMDVRVGAHVPPPGGQMIRKWLSDLLQMVWADDDWEDVMDDGLQPFHLHRRFEHLHPFMDGNGRAGRALWLWQMVNQHGYDGRRGFLHEFYYQSLRAYGPDQ